MQKYPIFYSAWIWISVGVATGAIAIAIIGCAVVCCNRSTCRTLDAEYVQVNIDDYYFSGILTPRTL